MAVIVGDTVEIVVSNPKIRNTLVVTNPAVKNTITVSPGYVAAANSVDGGGTGTVTSVTAGDGLAGGTIYTSGTISLPDTNVTPGQYTSANITVDEKGRITYAVDGSGGGTSGEAVTEQLINITNFDAAFTHMDTPIAIGTSLEDILIDMLVKYNVTTISLYSLTASLRNTDGTWSAYSVLTSIPTRELGAGVRVNGFTFYIGDNTQTDDNSVSFLVNGSTVQAGMSDSQSVASLSEINEQFPTLSPTTVSYRASAIDGSGSTDVTIQSNTKTISFKRKVKVGYSDVGSIIDSTAAQSLYDSMGTIFDALHNEGTIVTAGSDGTNNTSNFTYIVYPESFGAISTILQGAIDVTTDFEAQGIFNISNAYSVVSGYRIYKTNDAGAFAVNTPITINF